MTNSNAPRIEAIKRDGQGALGVTRCRPRSASQKLPRGPRVHRVAAVRSPSTEMCTWSRWSRVGLVCPVGCV